MVMIVEFSYYKIKNKVDENHVKKAMDLANEIIKDLTETAYT
jgi:hypothetical protein